MGVFRTWMVIALLCSHAWAEVEVNARLSSDSAQAGQAVRLSLVVRGGSPEGEPVFAEVEGLVLNQRGRSHNMQIVNGRMSRSITYTYVVGSMKPGVYEVPPAVVTVDGAEYRTQAMKLTVLPDGNAAPPGTEEGEEAGSAADKYGYLVFQLAKKERKNVYPGEIAPVRIRAYFPADARVSLDGPPRPEGSAFTLHNLSQEPQQTSEVVDGKRYLVVTWFGGLSATKAGEYPASFKLTGRVSVRDRSARRRPSMFDDPFFGGSPLDDFFAPVVEKEVELSTAEPPVIEVTELPLEGRPDDFSGAIGEFGFELVRVPSSLQVGEPCRVEARITGSGNFSLLKEPHPLPVGEWKSYPGEDEFMPGDAASFAGSKAFRFNAVPLAPREGGLSLGFSYFDPEKGEYRTVESEPVDVVITGEAAVPEEATPGADFEPSEPPGPGMAPIRETLGATPFRGPWCDEVWFVPVIAGSGVLSLGILGVGWWRSRGVDPERQARRRTRMATREALETAGRAAESGDAVAFFSAARTALRHVLAESTGISPEALTRADLRDAGDGDVAAILAEADRIDYSGVAAGTGDLGEWRTKLETEVAKLEAEGKERAA